MKTIEEIEGERIAQMNERIRRIEKAEQQFREEHGREPTIEEFFELNI